MANKVYRNTRFKNGKSHTFPVTVTGDKNGKLLENVKVVFTIEEGNAVIANTSVDTGSFSGNEWTIGDMSGGVATGSFTITSQDDDVDYVKVKAVVSTTTLGESPTDNNTQIFEWEGISFNELSSIAAGEKIEIPNTEFVDKTNPEIDEVRTWVDANLTADQLINSQLYMLEEEVTITYPQTGQFLDRNGSDVATVLTININGTSYDINQPFEEPDGTTFITDTSALIAAIDTALVTEGYNNVTIGFNQFGLNAATTIDQTEDFKELVYFYTYTDDSITKTSTTETNTPTRDTASGTTHEEPDYVWTVIDDEITEVFRRVNEGNVYYLDSNLSSTRTYLSQKGNPDRPFKEIADLPTLVAGDKVILRAGTYTGTFTAPSVEYYYASAAVHDDGEPINITTPGDIIITGFGRFIDSVGTSSTFRIENVSDNVYIKALQIEEGFFNCNKSGGKVFFDIDKLDVPSAGECFGIYGGNTEYYIHSKETYVKKLLTLGYASFAISDVDVYFNIDKLTVSSGSGSQMNVVGGDNCNVYLNSKVFYSNGLNAICRFRDNTTLVTSPDNIHVFIATDEFIQDNVFGTSLIDVDNISTPCSLTLNCKKYTEVSGDLVLSSENVGGVSTFTLNVNGNFETASASFAENVGANSVLKLSGYFKAANHIVEEITTGGVLDVKDARLICTDNTGPEIQASAAQNVLIQNVTTNILTGDADVTEVGGTIIRNASYT